MLLAAVFALGCGNPPRPTNPDGRGSNVAANGSDHGSAHATSTGTVPDIGCLTPSCALHPNTGAYFTCLAGGAGVCFHFGAPCTPEAACMYDVAAKTYKTCTRPVEGTCETWGATCTPPSKCMLDPADNLHKKCDDAKSGTCARYGALCSP